MGRNAKATTHKSYEHFTISALRRLGIQLHMQR